MGRLLQTAENADVQVEIVIFSGGTWGLDHGFATPLVEKRKHAGFNKPRVGGFTSKNLTCHRHHG